MLLRYAGSYRKLTVAGLVLSAIAMIFSSLLLVFYGQGASEISTVFGLNQSFGDILTGIVLFFIIGCEFFINYQLHFRKSTAKEGV